MANRRQTLNFAAAIAIVFCLSGSAAAQSAATSQADAIKSEIYFGSHMGAGQSVGPQAWEEFLSEVVTTRFPAGITVVEALGKGTRTIGPLTRTRIVVVIHASGGDAQDRLKEIKAEYKKRFGSASVFHTEQRVQIRDP